MNESLSLRAVEPEDLPIFFAHQLDPEATRMAAFPPRDHESFMAHWTTKILGSPEVVSRTIIWGGRVVGNVGAWTDAETQERFICYWIGREFWGQGLATAAVRLLIQIEPSRPLAARVVKHNVGSIRVLEKVGFTRAGEDAFTGSNGTRHEEFVYVLKE